MRDEKETKYHEIQLLGGFRLNRSSGQLTDVGGQIHHLRRQSADVLLLLAMNHGDVVSKAHLTEQVWPGLARTDDSLVQCIADIRRILGREAIENFPKKGYRLLAPQKTLDLQSVSDSSGPVPSGPDLADPGPFDPVPSGPAPFDPEPPVPRSMRATFGLVGGAVLLAGALIAHWVQDSETMHQLAPPIIKQENTLAVLPFANLSGDPKNRYFSDGLSEDLATDLSKVKGLTVISYASSVDYVNAESGFLKIAQDLGVRYLVRGTVRHADKRIRINVSLVDVNEGFNIWTERYDKSGQDPFDMQEEVVHQIIQAMALSLDIPQKNPQRVEPGAYFLLLRGLEPLRERTASGNIKARKLFEQALLLHPEYARAHASIAMTYARAAEPQVGKNEYLSQEFIGKGLEAAVTAIQLDNHIPHAYQALGLLNLALNEYDNAFAAVNHAVTLDRNFSEGYALLAELDLYGGDLNEGLIAIRRAKRLHPHHPPSYHWIEGSILYQLQKFEEALPLLVIAAGTGSTFLPSQITLAANHAKLGNPDAAADTLKAASLTTNAEIVNEVSSIRYQLHERRQALIDGLMKLDFSRK